MSSESIGSPFMGQKISQWESKDLLDLFLYKYVI